MKAHRERFDQGGLGQTDAIRQGQQIPTQHRVPDQNLTGERAFAAAVAHHIAVARIGDLLKKGDLADIIAVPTSVATYEQAKSE